MAVLRAHARAAGFTRRPPNSLAGNSTAPPSASTTVFGGNAFTRAGSRSARLVFSVGSAARLNSQVFFGRSVTCSFQSPARTTR